MKLVDPVPGVGQHELPDRSGLRPVEVQGRPPLGGVAIGEVIGRVSREVVAVGAQVVVDDVEDDAQARGVRSIHEPAQVVRRTVEARRREQADAVVSPAESPGKVRDGHHLQHGDPEIGQRGQVLLRGGPRPLAREGADVQLVEHLPLEGDAAPAAVRPRELPGIDDLRRTMRTFGLIARRRIGVERVPVEADPVPRTGPCLEDLAGEVAALALGQLVRRRVRDTPAQDHLDRHGGGRPNAKVHASPRHHFRPYRQSAPFGAHGHRPQRSNAVPTSMDASARDGTEIAAWLDMTTTSPLQLVRRMSWSPTDGTPAEVLLTREWIVTNGLGGYASGTVAGVLTRRYHGVLIAALPAPLGRTVLLSRLTEHPPVVLSGDEHVNGAPDLAGTQYLQEFRLETGLPVWRYAMGEWIVEKALLMLHMQNTVHVTYRCLRGEAPVRLTLRPSMEFRSHHAAAGQGPADPGQLTAVGDHYEVSVAGMPPLRLQLRDAPGAFTVEARTLRHVFYRVEARRGYEAVSDLWSPGYFRAELAPGAEVTLVASTESWDTIGALTVRHARAAERERRHRLLLAAHPAAIEGPAAELVLAADQFIITPAGRVQDAARSRAVGDEARTVIAGYHWFTDWGRDTMIGLEGLGLTTGRHAEAASILRTFAYHVRDGLIPNMFPEGEAEGRYHTADATLWFFHAIDRYVALARDRETLRSLLPLLSDIVDRHVKGTRFGVGVDGGDGLLRQGEPGYQLTWMDAKVGDWVVTPRRGKAVEINGLWYNALRLLQSWLAQEDGEHAARPMAELAEQVSASFNRRFWYEAGGYLYDVVDGEHGDDPACRPNQLIAMSLPHPVLAASRWPAVLDVVCQRLLTPVGLRSLAPGHPDYQAHYDGDLRARDAAYHQGTVWPWLIGPLVDAWLRVHHDSAGARRLLEGLIGHLDEACLGSISEVFDAEAPFTPRGCIAQAWSVAEVLRAWVATTPGPPSS